MNYTFILASERSGGNLLLKILDAHSAICAPSPKHLISPIAKNLFKFGDLTIERNRNVLIELTENLYNCGFSDWNSTFPKEILLHNKNFSAQFMLKAILKNELETAQKRHLVIKENQLYEYFPFVKDMYHTHKLIYLVRDPREMALSWKKNPGHQGGVVSAAQQWKKDQLGFSSLHSIYEKHQQSLLVYYEDLILKPEETIMQILSFLSECYEPTMLNFFNNGLTVANAKKQFGWKNLAKPIIKENHNKFLKELTEHEISIIEKICFYEMKSFSYDTLSRSESIHSIKKEDILELECIERDSIIYKPSVYQTKNMEAKRKFYELLL